MAARVENNRLSDAIEAIISQGFEGLKESVELLINEAMQIERSRHLGGLPYERLPKRKDYANGFKSKQLKTRLGELSLQIPQVREGNFYPSFLEKGIRSERALKTALSEMYIQGVSTRKVNAILEELCGCEISSMEVSRAVQGLDEELGKWKTRPLEKYSYVYFDARYEKVREGGCVVNNAVLIAYGVNEEGKREILGLSTSLSESEIHWRQFFESLVSRGLHGMKLIISDAHSGLKAALKTVFPSVPWQRCQFHLQQNAQSYITKKDKKSEVAESIRAIFNAENDEEAKRLLKLTVQKYEKEMPQLSQFLEKNVHESLTVFQFPVHHRKRLRTSNIAERVNQEIKKRTRVVKIFPNVASCERLITALVIEISEQWLDNIAYLTFD